MATSATSFLIPDSILIVGSGVFGLSTAYSLATDPDFKDTKITVVDRHDFPAADASSIDTSRIIRADYADPDYAALAFEAQAHWRSSWGSDGRYTETGLCVVAEPDSDAYVRSSLANVRALLAQYGDPRKDTSLPPVEELSSTEDIRRVMGNGLVSGSTGYLNRTSGWADAEACMRFLHARVVATRRVEFVRGTVDRMLFSSSSTVAGVRLTSSSTIAADLTILAAGAWTPSLLDTRGVARATGQVLAYIPLDETETKRLALAPTLLDLSSGLFVIPPSLAHMTLKVARHGHGYVNPTSVAHPERQGEEGEEGEEGDEGGKITTSLPRTHLTEPAQHGLPAEATLALRGFLKSSLPHSDPIATRPFSHTRLCWYTDTPRGDFVVSYHPSYAGTLFVASGGSGHAFKFSPVIGKKIVGVLKGNEEEWARKWRWPENGETGEFGGDGSRGGARGMVLGEEMAGVSKL